MKTKLFLPPSASFAILILSLCLTAASVTYQRSTPAFCYGNLAAGFPLLFICDTTAESPTMSWNKIDSADLSRIHLKPLLMNVLFYAAAAWVPAHVLVWLRHRRRLAKQE
jgi:hypothetical protein